MRRRNRMLLALTALLIAVAVTTAALLSRGSYEWQLVLPPELAEGRPAPPAWTSRCGTPGDGKICARVRGRVVWIERRDPDGDGDRHLVVVENLNLRIVKAPAGVATEDLPGIGRHIDAAGRVTTGASGRREIKAHSLR